MRVVSQPAAASAPAPYAAAETAFAEAKAYLSSREARQMSESDLERELHRRGQDLMQKLLQGHLDQRRPGEAAGPVAGTDGVERRERRVHKRAVETIFGTVDIDGVGYARPGHESLHPLDASLNLPVERLLAGGAPSGGGGGGLAVFRRSVVRSVPQYRCGGAEASGGTVGGSRGGGLRRVLRGAACGGGRADAGGVGGRAHLRRQGGGAAPARTARGDAQGGGAASAATGAGSPRSIA